MRQQRSRIAKLFDDTFLNGIVTIVVIAAAVYVSYTANSGLPFVPTYRVSIDVPNAGQLVRHADVRVGGARVGQVLEIHAVGHTKDHPPFARLDLALDQSLRPLARDTRSEVRIASILGGKYVALVPGHSNDKLAKDDVLPLAQATPSVDIDEAFRVLDPPTRAKLRSGITELGNGLAGRGGAVNDTIASLSSSSAPFQRVLANLADPATNLSGFLSAAAATSTTLSPVAGQLASIVDNGATTFAAVQAAGGALGTAVQRLPGAVTQSTTTLRHLRPALAAAKAISRDLTPASKLAPRTLARLDTTLRAATPVALHARTLAPPLTSTFASVMRFARDPLAAKALHLLGDNDLATFGASGFVGLGAVLATVGEAQLNCNVAGLWMGNLADAVSDGDANGPWLPLIDVLDTQQTFRSATPSPNLHINQYPHENAQECEAGNEPYAPGQAIGNPAGNQSKTVAATP